MAIYASYHLHVKYFELVCHFAIIPRSTHFDFRNSNLSSNTAMISNTLPPQPSTLGIFLILGFSLALVGKPLPSTFAEEPAPAIEKPSPTAEEPVPAAKKAEEDNATSSMYALSSDSAPDAQPDTSEADVPRVPLSSEAETGTVVNPTALSHERQGGGWGAQFYQKWASV